MVFWICFLVLVLFLGAASWFFFNFGIARNPLIKMHGSDSDDNDYCRLMKASLAYVQALPQEKWCMTSHDGLALQALYIPAQQPTGKTVMACHGYHANGTREYAAFVRFLHEAGYNILMPDARGHGASEGNYVGFGWLERPDVLQWLHIAKEKIPQCSVMLLGVSMGSATVLMAAGEAQLPAWVKGVVADCGYTSAWDEFCYEMREYFHLPPFPFLYLASGWCKLLAGYSFHEANTLAQVKHIKVPVLFIHGDSDKFVPTAMAQPLFDACSSPQKQLWLAPGAGHAESHVKCRAEYEQRVLSFLDTLAL